MADSHVTCLAAVHVSEKGVPLATITIVTVTKYSWLIQLEFI